MTKNLFNVVCTQLDNPDVRPCKEYMLSEEQQIVQDALDRLTPREKHIMILYHGFDGIRDRTLKAIAEKLEKSNGSVYWTYRTACHKLACDRELQNAFLEADFRVGGKNE